MAKKHKAPTQVTLVQEEKSPYAQWVENNWRKGAVLAVIVTGAILFTQFRGQREAANRDADWEVLALARATGDPAEVLEAARALAGKGLEGWAILSAAQIHASRREYTQARDVALRIGESGDPILTRFPLPQGGEDGQELTIAEGVVALLASQAAQDEALSAVFQNAPPAADAPRVELDVRVAGTVQTMTIGLYPEQAPEHVENFLKLVDEEYYVGVKFHRVMEGFMIQTGDPNTKDPTQELATWGLGGPDYKLDPETGDLVHAKYVLAAAKGQGEIQSSGSQFYITTGTPHYLDEVHTVFGAVVAGHEVVDAIESVEIRPAAVDEPGDVPAEPVPTIVATRRVTD